jgi:hypothetical protein
VGVGGKGEGRGHNYGNLKAEKLEALNMQPDSLNLNLFLIGYYFFYVSWGLCNKTFLD